MISSASALSPVLISVQVSPASRLARSEPVPPTNNDPLWPGSTFNEVAFQFTGPVVSGGALILLASQLSQHRLELYYAA